MKQQKETKAKSSFNIRDEMEKLVQVAKNYIAQGEFFSALSNARKLKKLAQQNQDPNFELEASFIEGQSFFGSRELVKAEKKYQLIIDHYPDNVSASLRAKNSLAAIAIAKGEYFPIAEEYLLNALEIIENLPNKSKQDIITHTSILINLAIIYRGKCDFDKSVSIIERSINLSISIQDVNGLIVAYSNAGIFYHGNTMYEKAIENFEKGINLAKKAKANIWLVILQCNLIATLLELENYEQTELEAKFTIKLANKLNHNYYLGLGKSFLAQVLMAKKNYKKAFKLINEALIHLLPTKEFEDFESLFNCLSLKIRIGLKLNLIASLRQDVEEMLILSKKRDLTLFYLVSLNLKGLFKAAELKFFEAKKIFQEAISLASDKNFQFQVAKSKENLEMISKLELAYNAYDVVISKQKKIAVQRSQEEAIEIIKSYLEILLDLQK